MANRCRAAPPAGWCGKCRRSEGSTAAVAIKTSRLKPVSAKKGMCQSKSDAKRSPIGTPQIEATENEDITMPMAAPRRTGGIMSAMMERIWAPVTPPNAPAMTRAATSRW